MERTSQRHHALARKVVVELTCGLRRRSSAGVMRNNKMKEKKINKRKVFNHIAWFICVLLFPIIVIAILPFVRCMCMFGVIKSEAYGVASLLVWFRLIIGAIIGEKKRKLFLYLPMPILLAFVVTVLAIFSGGH